MCTIGRVGQDIFKKKDTFDFGIDEDRHKVFTVNILFDKFANFSKPFSRPNENCFFVADKL